MIERLVDASRALRVLLVDDDEDDYRLTRELVDAIDRSPCRLDWVAHYDDGVRALTAGNYDVCLLDYRLADGRTGLDFVREIVATGCTVPIIMLTGQETALLEKEVLTAGAADYLVKGKFDVERLWRSLRHALDRQRAIAALRAQDHLFRAVFDAAMDAMLILDDDARFVDGNPAALELYGVTREQLLEKRIHDFKDASRAAEMDATWSEFLRVGTHTGELGIVRPDGASRDLEIRATANILPSRHLAVIRDVTERRRAEGTRMRLAAIVDSAEDGIVGEDLDGIVREWNPGAERIYGCRASEAVGLPATRFVPADRLDEWREMHRGVPEGSRITHLETVRQRSDGTIIDVSLTVSPLRDASGKIVGWCTITRDISETKKLRARLAIADRLASVGTLAAGVAHEINNPLAAVIANLDYVRADLSADSLAGCPQSTLSGIAEALRDAMTASLRVRDIVRDLKLFSRPDEDSKGPVDVRRALQTTLRMVANEVRHRARLIEDYADTPPVTANESRLGQVILNLLVNAVQAIPEGDVQNHEVRVATLYEGDRVWIAISDTGGGIPPEHRDRIFDPFFTTKPVGVGTGLGLSICQGIVTSLGGEITVTSEVGKGTTFRVSLPASPLRESVRMSALPQGRKGPRGRVLVIDDDPLLLKVVAATLTRHHEVTALTDAHTAIAKIEGGESYDVILCDLMMPQVSGMEVYAELLRVAPEMAKRTVFMTGGAFTPRARAFLAEVPNPTVEKPFEPRALLELVREWMPASGRAAPR